MTVFYVPSSADDEPLPPREVCGDGEDWSELIEPPSGRVPRPVVWRGSGNRGRYDRQTFQQTPVELLCLHNATLFGLGQVANSQGLVLTPSARHADEVLYLEHRLQSLTEAYAHSGDTVTLNPALRRVEPARNALLLSQPGFRSYGHFLLDVLPKLQVLAKIGERVKLVFHYQPTPWQEKIFALMGYTREDMMIYNPRKQYLRFGRLYICTQHRGIYDIHPSVVHSYDTLKAKVLGDTTNRHSVGKKLYCAAPPDSETTRITNEDAVRAVLEARGFETVNPETLTLEEQVELFSKAAMVVGVATSALHNTVFSPRGTRVLVLMSEDPVAQRFAQAGVGMVLDQPTGFLFGRYEGEHDVNQTGRFFSVSIDQLTGALDELSTSH